MGGQQAKESDWKKSARDLLKTYYTSFSGTQWHEFNSSTDKNLVRAKIGYALFGPPTNAGDDMDDIDDIENAYNDEQRERAQGILDVILRIYDASRVPNFRVGFIFVFCKQNDNEFAVPVFSVFVGTDGKGNDMRNFVDTQGRTYKDWDDWKNNNCLPKLDYAYPELGYFTCSGNSSYEYDPEQDPDIEYGSSPQSSVTSDILKWTDVGTSVASLGSGIIGIAACFTPIGSVVLGAAAIAGTSSAVYGATRGVTTLVDKGTHGQSLTDLESLTMWVSIIATPFHFVSSAVNGTLAMGAQQGRIFSSSMRMFATLLNFTTLGLDFGLLSFGIINLIKKAVDKELTTLDVLQFSMSVFFFSHTLMQPRVASKIIRRAQEMHFDKMATSMTDDAAKKSFKNFLDQNKSDGSITDRSKIVRTINRMDDPGKFFKSVGPDATMKVGGRKGKTVLVSDQHGHTNRVQPNNFHGMFTQNDAAPGVYKFNKDYNRLKKCYAQPPEDVELNGVKIFENLDDRQKRSISKTVGGTARSNKDLILTAHGIAEEMGYKTSDELMSMIEIVAKEVEGKSGAELSNTMSHISSGAGRDKFVSGIQGDLNEAIACASRGGLKFDNPLTAVYHYRKHGADFPTAINKFGNTIEVYLDPVRNQVFDDVNLREVCKLQDGIVRKMYTTNSDKFGVITSTPEGAKISTMFVKTGVHADYEQTLAKFFNGHVEQGPPEAISDAAQRLARFMGFRAMHILISVNGIKKPVDECPDLDPSIHEHIARLLNALEAD